jgi:hypothetical protein
VAEPTDVNDPDAIEIVACGRPVPGHEIRIVDEAGREVQERREGRLEFRGPSATSGYFHNEAKTRELFRGGWLDSGDQAYIANGDVFITGRIKDIIIRAGQHVYPQELEEGVGDIVGAIKGAVAAFGVSDPASGTERIVLLAETAQTATAELESLKARARAVVTEIIGSPPDDIVFVEPGTVPKTSSGKIRRATAKEHYLVQQLTVPRRALKWQIARLWLGGIGGRLTRLGEAAREYLYAAWWWGILSICVAIGAIAVWILPRRKWRCFRWTAPAQIGCTVHRTLRADWRHCRYCGRNRSCSRRSAPSRLPRRNLYAAARTAGVFHWSLQDRQRSRPPSLSGGIARYAIDTAKRSMVSTLGSSRCSNPRSYHS